MTRAHAPSLRIALALAAVAALALLPTAPAEAGGSLQTYDVGSAQPSPFPGFSLVDVVPIRWDARCMPIQYSMNDTLDPIPNPFGAPVFDLAQATAALQGALDAWNEIPTSYVDMQITGTTSNPGTRGFDFVNELTFRTPTGFGAIASSPSVSLISDVFLPAGLDVDGDGDGDVSAAIATCQDVDGDGDVELPQGAYAAGTILDNDVQFNAAGLRFTIDPAQADAFSASVDLVGVAVHEFGHSHGLSHVLNNQKSGTDGGPATMYPFIDTGDPVSELQIRSLDSDDVAFSSYFYPEGSDSSGVAALQAGDVAFHDVYTLVEGEVTDGATGEPIAGASVGAFKWQSDELVATAFSGQVRLLRRNADGALFFPQSIATGVADGRYVLPLPKDLYQIGIEAVDGSPVPTSSVNFTTQVGNFFGQNRFQEEFFDQGLEGAIERDPARATPVAAVQPVAHPWSVDVVTNVNSTIRPHGDLNFFGFTLGPAGLYYAVQFPRAEVQAAFDSGLELLQAGYYETRISDASVVPVFAEAALVTGVANGDGTYSLDLADPLRRQAPFVGQDGDTSPFYFERPHQLSKEVERWLDRGPAEEDLFLILRVPEQPWPGPAGLAPGIGLDGIPGGTNDVPIFGRSFFSIDGGVTFRPDSRFNFMFSLLLSEAP